MNPMPSVASGGPAGMMAADLLGCIEASDDAGFDRIYPPAIRGLSAAHWSPVAIARRAARYLVREPGTRVLDIGCGPGKFCMVGALTTAGLFTGIERRAHLREIGRKRIAGAGIANAEIQEGNVDDVDFTRFDAFYIFNPFAENVGEAPAIDTTVPLSAGLYATYTGIVAAGLAAAPPGTRVVTYWGACEEVPPGYACVGRSENGELKFWEKRGD